MTTRTISAIVAGTGFEGREEVIRKHCREGAAVRLEREPQNKFDPSAIAVYLQCKVFFGLFKPWAKIGYIKAARADGMATKIDAKEMTVLGASVKTFYAPTGREHPRVSLAIHIDE